MAPFGGTVVQISRGDEIEVGVARFHNEDTIEKLVFINPVRGTKMYGMSKQQALDFALLIINATDELETK